MMGKSGTIGLRVEDFTSKDNRPGWCSSGFQSDLTDYSKSKPFVVRHWSTISRVINLCLVVTVWCLLLFSFEVHHDGITYYMIIVVTLISFFETMFINHHLFCKNERKDIWSHKVWDFLLKINTWKKLILYIFLTIPSFVKPDELPYVLVSGILINLVGITNFIHLFRQKNEREPIRYSQLGID